MVAFLVPVASGIYWGIWWLNSPPLRIRHSGDGVTVGVETMGEYMTTISRLRLSDTRTGAIVWEVRADGKTPQIWRVELIPGENQPALTSIPMGRKYKVVTPRDRPTFTLTRGTPYLVEVWGASPDIFSSRATFEFAPTPNSK